MASSNSELSSTSLETVTEASAENVVGNPLSEKPETLVEPVPEGTAIEDDLAPKSIMKSDLIDKSGPANKSVSEKSATALIGSEAPESPVGEILKVVSTESDLLEKQEPLIESISKVVEGSLSEISDVIPEKVVSTENTSIEKSQETTTDNDKFQEIEEIVEPMDAIKKSILDSPVSLVEPSTSQEENKLDMASGVESASSVDETTTIKLVIKNVEVPEKSPAEIVDDVSLSGLEEAVQNLEAIIQHTESETQDKMETEPGPTDAEEPEKSAKILTSFEKDVNTVPELQREDEPMIVTKSSEKESSRDSTVDNNVTEAKITTTVDAKSDEKMDFEEETNEMDVNEKIDNAECVDNKVAADQIPKSLEKMETSETVDDIVEDALSVVAIVSEAIQQDTVKLKKGSEEEISKPVKISKDEKVKDSLEPQQSDKESQAGKENTAVNDDVTMIVLDSDEENDTITPTSKPPVTPVKQPSVLIQISPKVVASRQKTPSPAKPTATPSNTITLPKAKTPLKPITTPTGNILKRKLENEVSAQTSPPKSHEVKECVNFECKKQIKEYLKAPAFILSFYRISRKLNKIQYICLNCFDDAVLQYEELCGALEDWQPLLIQNIPCRDDLVEISDSSDDEDGDNKPIPDDESPLSKEAIKLVETDLEDILADTLKRVRISNQISWAKSMLETKAKINEEISNDILDDLRTLQRKADKMYKKLYSTSEPIYEELPPLDIHHTVEISTISIPPLGDLTFPSITKGASYFGVRHRLLAAWSPCTAIDVIPLYDSPDKICKVLFKGSNSKTHVTKNLPLKHISYFDAARVRLTIGTRVIALFNLQKANNLKQPTKNSYFPGIIAEPIQMTNAYR